MGWAHHIWAEFDLKGNWLEFDQKGTRPTSTQDRGWVDTGLKRCWANTSPVNVFFVLGWTRPSHFGWGRHCLTQRTVESELIHSPLFTCRIVEAAHKEREEGEMRCMLTCGGSWRHLSLSELELLVLLLTEKVVHWEGWLC